MKFDYMILMRVFYVPQIYVSLCWTNNLATVKISFIYTNTHTHVCVCVCVYIYIMKLCIYIYEQK